MKKTAKKKATQSVDTSTTTAKPVSPKLNGVNVPKGLEGWPKEYTELFDLGLRDSQIAEVTGKSEGAVYAKRKTMKQAEQGQQITATAKVGAKKLSTTNNEEPSNTLEGKYPVKVITDGGAIAFDPSKVEYLECQGFVFSRD